ncbi:MAG: TadE/TadG family type IV pilus assembly protein [Actinomycetota bacterium]
MVEMAIVMPLFLMLLFGIMEAGWAFSQQVEMRNATREGARLAVVDWGTGDQVIDETCSRADLSGAGTTFTVTVNTESVTVNASKTYQSLTGMIDGFAGLTMSSSVEMRTERALDVLTDASKVCP